MKKLFAVLLVLALIVGFVGCTFEFTIPVSEVPGAFDSIVGLDDVFTDVRANYAWVFHLATALSLLWLILVAAALVSVNRKDATRSEKLPWILLIIFTNVAGPILYFVIGKKQLEKNREKS